MSGTGSGSSAIAKCRAGRNCSARTREFLDYFGLKSLDDLPTLAELQDLDDINEQLDLPGAPTVVEPVALPPPTAQGEEAAAELDDMLDDEAAADDEDEDRPQLDAPTLVASPPDDGER